MRALPCLALVVTAACTDARRSLVEELARVAPPRSISPHLSIAPGYLPCTTSVPDGGSVPRARCPRTPGGADAASVAARARDSLRAGADAGVLHAVGVSELLWARGAGNRLARSISYLEAAARLAERPAPVLADLSAAYLVRAERTQAPRDLLLALETASRAAELAPDDATALYNRALALDRFGLDDEAVVAWRRFLAVDGESGWAQEARSRVAVLDAAPAEPAPPRPGADPREVAAFARWSPQEAGEHGWRVALDEWGAAVERGDVRGAARWLALAEGLGAALERAGRDASLADAVRAIRGRAGDAGATRALAAAHRAYARASDFWDAGDVKAAAKALQGVPADGAGSRVLGLWGRQMVAITQSTLGEGEVVEPLRTLLARTDTLRYPVLTSRVHVAVGTVDLRGGEPQRAIRSFRAAIRHLERAGEGERLGGAWYLMADAQFALGDAQAAYASAHRALGSLRLHRTSVWTHNLLSVLGEEVTADGLLRAAMAIHGEGARAAGRSGRRDLVAEVQVWMGQTRAEMGDLARARTDIRAGAATLAGLSTEGLRPWIEEDLRLARAVTMLPADPARAATLLDSVVAAPEELQSAPRRMRALTAVAEARLATHDVAGAMAALEGAARMLEAGDRLRLRAALRDGGREVFDRIVLLRLAAGDTAGALAALERGRASLSPTTRRHDGGHPWRIPNGSVAVSFALIGDTLLAWTVGGSRTDLTRSVVDRGALLQTLERVRGSLELRADGPAVRADLAALYDRLVRPVAMRLGPAGTPLLLTADGELAGVPFAALLDGQRFLVERHPLRWVGSLRDAWSPQIRGAPGSALLVADPAFDAGAHPGLARLDGARAEAAAVAALYPSSRVLSGDAASPRALEEAMDEAAVVHVAGHAVFDDERPERSFLVLAPELGSTEGGRLTATEMERMRLGPVRLVVLSACQTLRSGRGRSGGFAGLAGALLGAGVGGVLGSGWRVDDDHTRALMIEFHRAYRRSGDAAEALRTAQLHLLRSPDPALRSPAAWAGFRYAGR